jgi:predicted RNA-binding protein YlxR (DUF448 family)
LIGHYYEKNEDNNESKKARGKTRRRSMYVCTDGLQLQVQKKKNVYAYTMEGHVEVGRSSNDQQGRHLMHLTQHPRLTNIRHDIISRPCTKEPQPLLVKVVSNEPDTPTKHEQTVEGTDPDVLVSSSDVKAPESRRRSTKQMAMQASTLRMSCGRMRSVDEIEIQTRDGDDLQYPSWRWCST